MLLLCIVCSGDTGMVGYGKYFVCVDAASVRHMAVVSRFQDSDYVNWVKAGQALLCTAEGM